MGNPHPTKSTRSPCTLSRSKRKPIKPVIRVVQIHNPVYVHTDAINFSSLVQKLTGRHTRLPAASQFPAHPYPCSHRSSADGFIPAHNEACRWRDSADHEMFEWNIGSAQRSSKISCRSFQNYAEASSPNNTSGSSEGYDFEDHYNEREYGKAFSNMSFSVQRFSELDIWAGLASDHALPDITMLPPLVL